MTDLLATNNNATLNTALNTGANSSAISGTESSKADDSLIKLSSDMDTFLNLLIAQLKNQDPTAPTDTAEFTNQLVQYSTVEQSIVQNQNLEKMQDKLDELISLQGAVSGTVLSGVNLIGKNIEGEGRDFYFDGSDPVQLAYLLPENATNMVVQVTTPGGTPVWTTNNLPKTSGRHVFEWDGASDFGVPTTAGLYRLVVTPQDHEAQPITADTFVTGEVTSVETVNGAPVLNMNGATMAMDDLLAVR